MNDLKIDSGRLLGVIDEIDAVWDSFVYGGPGIVSAAQCRQWADRLLVIMDDGEAVKAKRHRRGPQKLTDVLSQIKEER